MRNTTTDRLLSSFISEQIDKMRKEILQEQKNSFLNVDASAYIEYLVNKYSIDLIICHWDNVTCDDCEKEVPANQLSLNSLFMRGISQNDHRMFLQYYIVCNVPYTGNLDFINYRPTHSLSSLPKVIVESENFKFEIPVDPVIPPKQIITQTIDSLRTQINYINNDLEQHNHSIKNIAENLVNHRKQELLNRLSLLQSIAIPISRTTENKEAIISIANKKILIQKPSTVTTDFVPDPAIDDATYQDILRMCYEMGVAMERRPSLYKDADGNIKCEEPLRDVFLVPLSLQFDSVTGETINKAGKTDILIRYMGKNAFIAECKFWRGKKMHHETIDQILNNLTWRDSKSAIIYFVDNKHIQSVLDQIIDITASHSCFAKYINKTEVSWFNFHFTLACDKTRYVKLAVLLVHLT